MRVREQGRDGRLNRSRVAHRGAVAPGGLGVNALGTPRPPHPEQEGPHPPEEGGDVPVVNPRHGGTRPAVLPPWRWLAQLMHGTEPSSLW